MKTKFGTVPQTIHVWAQQEYERGENSGGRTVFFEGAALYSYGYHFPMACFLVGKDGGRGVVLNNDRYSVTTSKHQSITRGAISHVRPRFYLPCGFMKEIVRMYQWEKPQRAIKKVLTKRVLDIVADALRADTATLRFPRLAKHKAETMQQCNDIVDFAVWYCGGLSAKARKAVTKFEALGAEELRDAITKTIKKENARKEKARKEKEERFAKMLPLAVAAWRRGESRFGYPITKDGITLVATDSVSGYINNTSEKFLRLNCNIIETSHGARFPIKDALPVFAMAQKCRAEKHNLLLSDTMDAIRIGHFKLDCINADGDITAGCHTIKFEEAELLYNDLKAKGAI